MPDRYGRGFKVVPTHHWYGTGTGCWDDCSLHAPGSHAFNPVFQGSRAMIISLATICLAKLVRQPILLMRHIIATPFLDLPVISPTGLPWTGTARTRCYFKDARCRGVFPVAVELEGGRWVFRLPSPAS